MSVDKKHNSPKLSGSGGKVRASKSDDGNERVLVESEELLNIPLAAVCGTDLPTRADVGGWLQYIDSVQEVATMEQVREVVPVAQPVRGVARRYATAGASVGGGVDLIAELEAEQLASIGNDIPDFKAGDTIRVGLKVQEGSRIRIQNFEGVCIQRKGGSGIAASFTVRKISFGEGVEKVFPLYSTNIDSITVVRRGRVRRAKLYYLRSRRGKSARIAEQRNYKPKRTPS